MPRDDSRAQHVAERLSLRYPPERWALCPQVQSLLGARAEGVRVADLIAVSLWPSDKGRVEVIEIKVDRQDFLAELEQPEKAAPFAPHASAQWIAVPAPWGSVVPSRSMVPAGWGLLSVGTGAPAVIVEAEVRRSKEPLPAFALSLLRAAQRAKGPAPRSSKLRRCS